jgi:hypothetical protein
VSRNLSRRKLRHPFWSDCHPADLAEEVRTEATDPIARARRPLYLGRAPMSSAAGPPLAAAASRTRHKRFPSPPALEQLRAVHALRQPLYLGGAPMSSAAGPPLARPKQPLHHVPCTTWTAAAARCAFELQLLALRRAARCHGPC